MVIRYSMAARKFLGKLDRKSVQRIRNAVGGLTLTPPVGDTKLLRGYSDGRRRLRVGDWRVIYRCLDDGALEVLCVMEIGNRGDMYKQKRG